MTPSPKKETFSDYLGALFSQKITSFVITKQNPNHLLNTPAYILHISKNSLSLIETTETLQKNWHFDFIPNTLYLNGKPAQAGWLARLRWADFIVASWVASA